MKAQSKQKVIKKLVTFTKEEWDFVQSYKHFEQLKTDMQAVKMTIRNGINNKNDTILSSLKRNQKILKELADK